MVSEVILGRKLSALAPSSQSKADRSTAGSAVRPGRSRRSNTDSAKMPSTLQAHVSPPIGWLMLNREGDRPRPDASTTASPPTSTMSPWVTGRAIFSNAKSHFPPSPHLKNEKGTMRTLHKSLGDLDEAVCEIPTRGRQYLGRVVFGRGPVSISRVNPNGSRPRRVILRENSLTIGKVSMPPRRTVPGVPPVL